MQNLARRRPRFAVTVQVQQIALSACPTAGASFDQLVLSVTGTPALTVDGSKRREFQFESQVWNFQHAQLRVSRRANRRASWRTHTMSLTAMLSLSSSSSTHPPKLLDFYQRIPFQGKLRRNSQGNYKPQHLHFRLYGTNKKSRYRSLLAGFSVDVIEHFDRLLALNGASSTASHRVPLTASDGVCAPQSSLSVFMDSLHFLPHVASSWHRKSVEFSNSSNSAAIGSATKDRQIELVTLHHRRRSPSRLSSQNDEAKSIRVARKTRSPSSSQSSSDKQNELRRAIRANTQLSSNLMVAKELKSGQQQQQQQQKSDGIEIGYEINEEELTNRFYTAVRSIETTSSASGVSTPATLIHPIHNTTTDNTIDDEEKEREQEWKAKQLDLERQVAALLAENQAKTALIKYLMDENSRLVVDGGVQTAEEQEEQHHCVTSSISQAESELKSEATNSVGEVVEPTSSQVSLPAPVSPSEVQVAKRKLQTEATTSVSQEATRQESFAASEAAFEGLVKEIQDELAQLFSFETSSESSACEGQAALAL